MTAPTAAEAADLFRRSPDRYVEVAGGAVAVRTVGEGPDVLFVHGWPLSGSTFRGLLPHLADHCRCHVLDLPGAGASRFDRATPLTLDEHVRSVRTVVDALDLDDVVVVGHDSGGMIARCALADDPRVTGWGLLDSEHPGRPAPRLRAFLALRRAPALETVLRVLLGSRAIARNRLVLGDAVADRDHLDGEFAEFALEPLRREPEKLWAAAELLRAFDLGVMAGLDSVHRRITAPVTVVHGDRDVFFPLSRMRAMMSGFGGPATLEVIAGGALLAHEEMPDRVAEALRGVVGRSR